MRQNNRVCQNGYNNNRVTFLWLVFDVSLININNSIMLTDKKKKRKRKTIVLG